jgi:RNA polymerase sigma-70 factor (ECF subfamily)
MNQNELIPHLFRTEFRKITSVLGRLLGADRLEMAEDIASETFLAAMESWSYKGIPENPVAWLYAVAKNKAKNALTRQALFDSKISKELINDSSNEEAIDWSDKNIADSQLQMLFALCHPAIPVEAQIGLSLRVLCGFGIEEIASAFLTNKEVINKRLFRAREKLREEKIEIVFPEEKEIAGRLEAVLKTLYLLFSEGYYSESSDQVLRQDLCLEAMRLAHLLTEYEPTRQPPVYALLSLMSFHASRFEARTNAQGEQVLYDEQDESKWNQPLIAQGVCFLNMASQGTMISKYHLEAGIAYWHTQKSDTHEKWENILQLYNQLLTIEYSPIAALNRTYALSKANGKQEAIREAEKLQLTDNHFYWMLLGELYNGMDHEKAKQSFSNALSLAKSPSDQRLILKRLNAL